MRSRKKKSKYPKRDPLISMTLDEAVDITRSNMTDALRRLQRCHGRRATVMALTDCIALELAALHNAVTTLNQGREAVSIEEVVSDPRRVAEFE